MNERNRRALVKGSLSFLAGQAVTFLFHNPSLGSVASAAVAAFDETLIPPIDNFTMKYCLRAGVWAGGPAPLHVQINNVVNPDELKALLKRFSRKSECTTALENGIRAVGCEFGQDRLEELKSMLLALVILNLGCTEEWIHVAAAVLTRFSGTFESSRLLNNFYDSAESNLESADAACVPTFECLAYACMAQGKAGLYYSNFRRYLSDPKWSRNDAREGDIYYGGAEASLKAVIYHYKHRPLAMHVHDVARVIHLYSLLRHDPEMADAAIIAKHGMLDAISAHDELGKKFRGVVEDMMESRRKTLWGPYAT